MKKSIFFLCFISLIILVPNVYADETCPYEVIKEYRDSLKNIDYTLEYLPKGTKIENYEDEGMLDVSNRVRINFTGVSEDFDINLIGSDESSYSIDHYEPEANLLDNGGVYTVNIYTSSCEDDVIKSFEIMVPYHNLDGKDNNIFSDGTYNSSEKKENNNEKTKFNIFLLLLIIILLAFIFGFIFIIKKRSSYDEK